MRGREGYWNRVYAGDRLSSRRNAGSRRLRRVLHAIWREIGWEGGGPDRPSDYGPPPTHFGRSRVQPWGKPNHAARAVDIDKAFGVVRDPKTERIKL